MDAGRIQILITMAFYMAIVIGIGVYFAKRSNQDSEAYFLGGRSLGPWVSAMSAEASDMSGWLLMGLPGVAYWFGLADAAWTAIGLAIGTYLNWLIVSKRLRRYSEKAGNAITLPEFFSNRFKENKKILLTFAAVFILIFFTVYAASCFVTCGKLFSTLFGASYVSMMILGAIFVLAYTMIGGFLAESSSDFMQGIVMIFALVTVFIVGTAAAGGLGTVMQNAKNIPGFLEFFGMANQTGIHNSSPVFGAALPYGFITIMSTMAWGLGYFGMPHVLLRFMAIREEKKLTISRRIAVVWVVIALATAVFIGIVGRTLYPAEFGTYSSSENIFILISTNHFIPVFAGLVMAGILAATISSSDSYLLIASSSLSKNLYQKIFVKNASEKEVMIVSRITLLTITVIAILIALDENSVIFTIVSFAWAGFGATFGPLMLFSLFWKRINLPGAIAGMLSGGFMVFFWKLVIRPLGGAWNIYELLPAFLFSCMMIVFVSLLTAPPSNELQKEFEEVKNGGPVF
ncbi:MAG: sodium/proline symporter PutP [Treponema sp.]|nr:sodium/proline symporter PutP [Treponema sp.]MCL2250508.1 sodium/proline symporter PutP [Treponema sp.]